MGQSIGRAPARAALTSGDINDGIITTAKIGAAQITAAKVAADVATQSELDGLVDSAPGALDTLNELAAALNDDADFSTTVTNSIATKLPKAGGAMTGAITTNSTFDGVDIATRDAVLTSTTTTAGAALPKAGGTMSGAINTNNDIILSGSGSSQNITRHPLASGYEPLVMRFKNGSAANANGTTPEHMNALISDLILK